MNAKQFSTLLLPLAVFAAIPGILLFDFQTNSFNFQSSPLFFFIGSLLCLAGISILTETINALHKIGQGTLAPWEPTMILVTSGLYEYSRNPMIGGGIMILAGEAIMFESAAILVYAFIVFIANSLYFQYIEEPALEKRFGQEYRDYKNSVPKWILRKTGKKTHNQ